MQVACLLYSCSLCDLLVFPALMWVRRGFVSIPEILRSASVWKPVFGHVGEEVCLGSSGKDRGYVVVLCGFPAVGRVRAVTKIGPKTVESPAIFRTYRG